MSSLCSQNLTLGVYTRIDPDYIQIEGNRVTGFIGRFYDKYLTLKDRR